MFAEGEGGFFLLSVATPRDMYLTFLETGDTIMGRYSGLGTQIGNLEAQGCVEGLLTLVGLSRPWKKKLITSPGPHSFFF